MLTVIIILPMNDATPASHTTHTPVVKPFAPSRGLRLWAAVTRWVLWVVMAIGLLFGATWGLLHAVIVPRIEDFRPRLESLASKALGMPVVGRISAQSSGLIPTFEMDDVTLQDAQGRQVLQLQRVLVALSTTSLLKGGFEQMVIDQPVLDIRRTLDARFTLAGWILIKNAVTAAPPLTGFSRNLNGLSRAVLCAGQMSWPKRRCWSCSR